MSFCFGIAMSIQPIWVGGWSFIGSQCSCAHIHVDVDVYELRVYFICEENISDFLDLAQKMGSDILFFTKSEKISQEIGPDYVAL